jgi:hypothetical protein
MDLPVTLLGWLGLGCIIVITALTAIGVRRGIDFAKENIKHVLFTKLRMWAGTYVAALAQDPSLKGLASEEKKERAMLWLRMKADALGVELSVQEASLMIEQAVFLLKKVLPGVADELSEPVG